MGFARKAFDKAKARMKAARLKGKGKPVKVSNAKIERLTVRAVLKDYRDAA